MRKLGVLALVLAMFFSVAYAGEVRKLGVEDIAYLDFTSTGGVSVSGIAPMDARSYESLDSAISAIGSTEITLLITETLTVTGDVTVPSNVTLKFQKGGVLSIADSKTVTVNGPIDAGYYQIVSFGNSTSAFLPGAGGQWSSTTVAHYPIKLDWFGTDPDAVIPTSSSAMGTVPTGSDSASAIRRAMLYAQTAAGNFPQSTSGPAITVLGTPNAVYYVTGANVLGYQLSTGNRDILFDGQGCSFLWNPTNTTDAFIDTMERFWRPVWKNFRVLAVGFSGSKGVFAHSNDLGAASPGLTGPHFYNIVVEGGKTSDYVSGFVLNNSLTKVFHIEDNANNDRFYIENCWFSQFDKFSDIENAESVSWTIFKSTITTNETNAIYFNFTVDYSGGFRVEQCDLLLAGNTQTIFKASGYTGSNNGDMYFRSNRVESPGSGTTFTVVDATFGKFYIEDSNFEYGSGIGTGSILSYALHPAEVYVENSTVPGTIKVYTRGSNDYLALTGRRNQLTVINSFFTTSYPTLTFIKDTDLSTLTYRQVTADGRSFRPILIRDCQAGSKWYNDIYYSGLSSQHGGNQEEFVVSFHRVGSSNPYIDAAAANIYLPAYSIVTSFKCFIQTANAATIDGVRVHIGSWTDNVAISDTVKTVAEFVSGGEFGIAVPLADDTENKVYAEYTLANVDASPDATPAYCILKYRAMRGAFELPATDVATMIGTE